MSESVWSNDQGNQLRKKQRQFDCVLRCKCLLPWMRQLSSDFPVFVYGWAKMAVEAGDHLYRIQCLWLSENGCWGWRPLVLDTVSVYGWVRMAVEAGDDLYRIQCLCMVEWEWLLRLETTCTGYSVNLWLSENGRWGWRPLVQDPSYSWRFVSLLESTLRALCLTNMELQCSQLLFSAVATSIMATEASASRFVRS